MDATHADRTRSRLWNILLILFALGCSGCKLKNIGASLRGGGPGFHPPPLMPIRPPVYNPHGLRNPYPPYANRYPFPKYRHPPRYNQIPGYHQTPRYAQRPIYRGGTPGIRYQRTPISHGTPSRLAMLPPQQTGFRTVAGKVGPTGGATGIFGF